MIIEAGKYYRRRDGKKAGPMEPYSHTRWIDMAVSRLYDNSGQHCFNDPMCDLIAEWPTDDKPDIFALIAAERDARAAYDAARTSWLKTVDALEEAMNGDCT
ncbi:hypothetical protein [Aestuariivirga sp.]|uniref:hypothetical protein n=1 Tax=Aestuariivirga sp. TaxID=2650926 RepID=UPI0039E42363